jgi:hypothetical protein
VRKIAESSASKQAKYEKIMENTKSSFINVRDSIIKSSCIGKVNVAQLRLSQVQCVDMFLHGLVEELKKMKGISQAQFAPKKLNSFLECEEMYFLIASLLKKNYLVIKEFKKSIKKHELEQKFMLDNFSLDNEDASELIESSTIEENNNSEYECDPYNDEHKSTIDAMTTNPSLDISEEPTNEANTDVPRGHRKSVYSKRNDRANEEEVL